MAELVFNEASRPRFSGIPFTQRRSFVDVPMPPKTTLPGCAVLSDFVYCPDASGAIHRTEGGGKDTVVAHSRAGTPLSVAKSAPDLVLLAYIRDEVTSEGTVRVADVKLDEGPPVRLSEEGSGATYVEVISRGESALALTLDGRTAMTPGHVRRRAGARWKNFAFPGRGRVRGRFRPTVYTRSREVAFGRHPQ